MELLRWMGWMLSRFVAISVAILSAWIFIVNGAVNLADIRYEGWILAWVLFSGLVGAVGGSLYLLTIDGPQRFRTRRFRLWGWGGMMAAVLLPTSLSLMLVPLVLVLIPTLVIAPRRAASDAEDVVTSS